MLLQEVCRQGLGWDEVIPDDLARRWNRWLADLPVLSTIDVARCFLAERLGGNVRAGLHSFADASEKGFAAVCYLLFVDSYDQVHCSFVLGKTRLSPLETVTIPRLELTAAVLAVQLSRMVQSELQRTLDDVVFWTDSTSFLQYIRSEQRRFHFFVANRVAKIRGVTRPSQWRHVRTDMYPADGGSRGLDVDEGSRLRLGAGGVMTNPSSGNGRF